MISLSSLIIIGCFVGVILFIITNRMNRAIAALSGAIITYFTLTYLENKDFSIVVELLFGTPEDGFVNLHSLILIFGIMIIVQISHEAGVFQFVAGKLIKLSKGKPIPLMIILCTITVIISAILNNILTVMILIPLTITVSRFLKTDPSPYILTQAILVNIGGTIFSISSIPNILITTQAGITFSEFFMNVGLLSILIYFFTIVFFIFLYKPFLQIPAAGLKILDEFDIWNFVQSKYLFYVSIITLSTLMICFIIIPADIIPPDMIALSLAVFLVISSNLDAHQLLQKLDYELIIYLLGIFIITGGLEVTGLMATLGSAVAIINQFGLATQLLIILWGSAIIGSAVDNIPITKIMIPIISNFAESSALIETNPYYYSLAIGANWGDNLTPLGDNILVMNIAEQQQRPISFKQFFKLGFVTTVYQLSLVSMLFIFVFNLILGLFIVLGLILVSVFLFILSKHGTETTKSSINKVIMSIRLKITR